MPVVQQPSSDSLASQLVALASSLQRLEADKATFNFEKIIWACPLLVLPIAVHIHDRDCDFSGFRENIGAYLNTVKFPHGVTTESELPTITKSYLPIGRLVATDLVGKEKLSAKFERMIFEALESVPGSMNAVYYPLSELLTNIFEHSSKDEGWIFAQRYPKKQYLDICIADSGRGLSASYLEEKGLALSHDRAIVEAMSGHSTKSEVERGYGLRTSKRVVCEGLKGSFVLLSGNAALIFENGQEKLVDLSPFNWQGVVISYRIPRPTQAIDIYRFLE